MSFLYVKFGMCAMVHANGISVLYTCVHKLGHYVLFQLENLLKRVVLLIPPDDYSGTLLSTNFVLQLFRFYRCW